MTTNIICLINQLEYAMHCISALKLYYLVHYIFLLTQCIIKRYIVFRTKSVTRPSANKNNN